MKTTENKCQECGKTPAYLFGDKKLCEEHYREHAIKWVRAKYLALIAVPVIVLFFLIF